MMSIVFVVMSAKPPPDPTRSQFPPGAQGDQDYATADALWHQAEKSYEMSQPTKYLSVGVLNPDWVSWSLGGGTITYTNGTTYDYWGAFKNAFNPTDEKNTWEPIADAGNTNGTPNGSADGDITGLAGLANGTAEIVDGVTKAAKKLLDFGNELIQNPAELMLVVICVLGIIVFIRRPRRG